MSTIIPGGGWWGETNVSEEIPRTQRVFNALYMPYVYNEVWGIFDARGRIVEEAVDRYGSRKELQHQKINDQEISQAVSWASTKNFVYFGQLNLHYGHFLINTFPRLWWLAKDDPGKPRSLLCHLGPTLSALEGFKFIGDILGALGIRLSDIEAFDAPMRISCVECPESSMHEQYAVHPILRELALKAAAGLGLTVTANSRPEPLYISKSRLKRAVGVFENEDVFEEAARSRGFRIMYPETMTFAQQVAALTEHRVVAGTVGSAFHTLLFCPPGKRLIGLNPGPDVNSNFGLIDRISGVNASYFAPSPDLVEHISGQEILTTHRLLDPQAIARDYFLEVEKAALESA